MSNQTFLKGKGKSGHFTDNLPVFRSQVCSMRQEKCGCTIVVVECHAMTLKVSDAYMFMKTTKEIWDSCKVNYSKVGDAAQI